MKVAIVNRHPADVLGGSETQCDNIATGLRERGHDVVYIAPEGKLGRDYQRSYQVIPVTSNAASISRAVINANPDVVYWRLNKFYLYRAARRISEWRIPIIFAISHINDIRRWTYLANPKSGIVQFVKAAKQGLYSSFNYRGYKHVAGVTSLNPDYLGALPVPKQRFVANSVDDSVVDFSWPRPFVAWVANIKPAKRPELYVRLARELAGRGVDFLMVGSIQSKDYEWIRLAPDAGCFHYLGPKTIQQVNGILARSLFLVHTCEPEGFGNVFIQAWLQRKPTVTLGFDPAGYISEHGLGGTADGNWEVFVGLVADLIENLSMRESIGQRAFAFARQNFSVAKTVEDVEAFMYEVTGLR